MKPRVLFLVGPTGSGKTDAALQLAGLLDAEIISADSMQVYRGMDIGTAKPSSEERLRVPHHLIDILEPTEPFSVYEYRELALEKIREISGRGKTPLVTGGTGLYVRAILEGLSGQPGASPEIRGRLDLEVERSGLALLYERLQGLDPAAAEKIKPADQKRIVRALEIYEISGKTPSEWFQSKQPLTELGFESLVIGMTWPRDVLYARIEQRVDRMFEAGLVEEVRKLSRLALSHTALQAVGYKELLETRSPQDGRWTSEALETARARIKLNSRHLAKRQMTWFRKEKGIHWMECSPDTNPDLIPLQIASLFKKS